MSHISYGWEYYGYQPYWYDGFYTPWYNPYRAYVIPFRPHKPIWRSPFHYVPLKPKHEREITIRPRGSGVIRNTPQRNASESKSVFTPPQRTENRTYSPPPSQPANSGGNRNSGVTRTERK
jgi:hypothetical protein